MCCAEIFVPLLWKTDLCVIQTAGTVCGTTDNDECAGDMGCALDERDGKTIVTNFSKALRVFRLTPAIYAKIGKTREW